MKRTIVAIACAMGCFCVGNAHNVNSQLPQKREKKEVKVGDNETKFVHELMQKMTLTEKIGQLSQYVGGTLLTGPQSGALSDSLFIRGMVGSILNVGGVDNIESKENRYLQT